MALPQAKLDATELRLAAMDLPQGGWSQSARASALTRVRDMGLPARRDEYWKYTRPDTFVAADVVPAALFDPQETGVFAAVDALKIVFVDGVFDVAQSDDLAGENLTIDRLEQTKDLDLHWGKDCYGVLETKGQTPVARPLAALNTAFATDGVLIHVTGPVERPVHLVYQHGQETSDAILHHVVKVDENASVTILESGPAAARFNKAMEVFVAQGARVDHIRVQGRDHERRAVTHVFAELNQDSVFKTFTLTANGVLTRNECVVWLNGDEGVAHIAGACVGDGDFHHDDTVFITHDAVACESRQVFKKVLRNGATGVFQGKILVKPDAQKTDGYQISQSLLLDDDSQFLAKPELEIYADDVACSHGSTSGAIDEEALYYLRSRGVPLAQATNLLTLAFLGEAVDEIENRDLADMILTSLEGWLTRHQR